MITDDYENSGNSLLFSEIPVTADVPYKNTASNATINGGTSLGWQVFNAGECVVPALTIKME